MSETTSHPKEGEATSSLCSPKTTNPDQIKDSQGELSSEVTPTAKCDSKKTCDHQQIPEGIQDSTRLSISTVLPWFKRYVQGVWNALLNRRTQQPVRVLPQQTRSCENQTTKSTSVDETITAYKDKIPTHIDEKLGDFIIAKLNQPDKRTKPLEEALTVLVSDTFHNVNLSPELLIQFIEENFNDIVKGIAIGTIDSEFTDEEKNKYHKDSDYSAIRGFIQTEIRSFCGQYDPRKIETSFIKFLQQLKIKIKDRDGNNSFNLYEYLKTNINDILGDSEQEDSISSVIKKYIPKLIKQAYFEQGSKSPKKYIKVITADLNKFIKIEGITEDSYRLTIDIAYIEDILKSQFFNISRNNRKIMSSAPNYFQLTQKLYELIENKLKPYQDKDVDISLKPALPNTNLLAGNAKSLLEKVKNIIYRKFEDKIRSENELLYTINLSSEGVIPRETWYDYQAFTKTKQGNAPFSGDYYKLMSSMMGERYDHTTHSRQKREIDESIFEQANQYILGIINLPKEVIENNSYAQLTVQAVNHEDPKIRHYSQFKLTIFKLILRINSDRDFKLKEKDVPEIKIKLEEYFRFHGVEHRQYYKDWEGNKGDVEPVLNNRGVIITDGQEAIKKLKSAESLITLTLRPVKSLIEDKEVNYYLYIDETQYQEQLKEIWREVVDSDNDIPEVILKSIEIKTLLCKLAKQQSLHEIKRITSFIVNAIDYEFHPSLIDNLLKNNEFIDQLEQVFKRHNNKRNTRKNTKRRKAQFNKHQGALRALLEIIQKEELRLSDGDSKGLETHIEAEYTKVNREVINMKKTKLHRPAPLYTTKQSIGVLEQLKAKIQELNQAELTLKPSFDKLLARKVFLLRQYFAKYECDYVSVKSLFSTITKKMREKKDISDIRRLKFVFNSIEDLEAVFGVFYDRNQQKGITRCQVKGKYKEHMKREFPDIGTVENPSSSDDWDIAKMTIPISVPLGLAGNAQEKANVDVEIMFQLVSDAAADLSAHRPRSHINYVTNREVGIARIANYVNAAVSNVIDNESQDVQ